MFSRDTDCSVNYIPRAGKSAFQSQNRALPGLCYPDFDGVLYNPEFRKTGIFFNIPGLLGNEGCWRQADFSPKSS